MSCNSESRRAINYSLQEPINNKYDLWLSENLRYNSEGSLIYDSPGQPACDLILKIYKDGDWKPIAGLSTEHIVANKINIVDGVNYTYISPNDNILHINNGFQLNHLPLFRNPQDSPNELFDAGTLGEAIYEFVTESEWLSIFEGDAFNNSFKLYFPTIIHNGDININDFIELANTEQIGGIKAALDPNDSDDCRNIPIVLAGPTVGSVWGLPFGGGVYPGDLDEDTEFLYLPGWALMEWMKNPYFDQQNPQLFISGWKGVDTQLRENSDLIWVGLNGVTPENANKFCIVRTDSTDPSGATIDWVDLSDYGIYPVLSSNSSEDIEYVINGGGKEGTYLDYNGEWTVPDKNEYHGGQFININQNNVIDVKPYTGQYDTRRFYICSENGSVSWQPIDTGETYDVLSSEDHLASKEYVINGCGNVSADKVFLNGNGEWAEPSGGITYTEGIGITISNEDNTNYININTEGADEGLVLSYDGDGGVEWRNVQSGEEYDAGDGIEINTGITPKKINAKISCGDNTNNNTFIVDLTLLIRTASLSGKNVIVASHDNDSQEDSLLVKPFTYLNIPFSDSPSNTSGEITFSVSLQTTIMDGDPVYFILSIPKGEYSSIEVLVEDGQLNVINDYIYSDDCVYLDSGSNYLDLSAGNGNAFKFLVTVLFGIVKIEKLGVVTTQSSPI